jgi:hypothetical protein
MKNRKNRRKLKYYPLNLLNGINQNLAAMLHVLSHRKVFSGSLTLH